MTQKKPTKPISVTVDKDELIGDVSSCTQTLHVSVDFSFSYQYSKPGSASELKSWAHEIQDAIDDYIRDGFADGQDPAYHSFKVTIEQKT